jgi:hypothetical protein
MASGPKDLGSRHLYFWIFEIYVRCAVHDETALKETWMMMYMMPSLINVSLDVPHHSYSLQRVLQEVVYTFM